MTPRGIGIALIWSGAVLLLGVLLYRLARGAWSLDDADIPPATWPQRLSAGAALVITALGIGLFVWDYS